MPKYLDHHAKLPQMPPEVVQQFKGQLGQKDALGVTGFNAFFSTDGQGWCFTEAPNAEAVCKSHEAKGIPLDKGDVYEVQTLA